MRVRNVRDVALLVVFCVCSAGAASAQGFGSIGGTVMDTSNAVLPGVAVSLSSAQGTVGSNQQTTSDARGAYQFLVDATIILYFIPFIYMFAAAIKLYPRPDRRANKDAVLIPGGQAGVWIVAGTGLTIVLLGILVSLVPPGDSSDKFGFEMKLVGGTAAAIVLGLTLYWRGARSKAREMA